jgi:holo-[acyl-carrier protein] synthase
VPISIGIDLVETDEVRDSLHTHGQRYLRRVYTDRELRECGEDPRLLAGRFAAKEAAMKALARGDDGLSWRSIGVRSDPSGALSLELTGEAAALAERQSVTNLTLSVTYRRTVAAAVVLAEIDKAR